VAPAHQIVAVIGHQAEQVRASVTEPGIRFAEQEEQMGTGHAVRQAQAAARKSEGKLLILNGDGPLLRPETLIELVNHSNSNAAGGVIVTTEVADPTGYGRIVRDNHGLIEAIVEQKAANAAQLRIREINPGVYCFTAKPFWEYLNEVTPNNAAKEYYLTDMIAILSRRGYPVAPLPVSDESELLGINTRLELAVADKILRSRKATELMLSGVTIENPDSVTVDTQVRVAPDTVLEANVQLRGHTRIGTGCRIGTGSVLRDCHIGDEVSILPYVVAEASVIGDKASVGPFARLRMNAEACEESHIGNFVELKNTKLGKGSKASHLAYLGDSQIGAAANIGAGTITCNYDGRKKHQTHIGEGAFVGSNSTLIAPVQIGEGSYVAAGSVITRNVPPDALSIGRSRQEDKPGWAKRLREATKGINID
jgi:bifunctional UDP-N-acetylglucosamine pyrophosphorylase/glucosamine-1-phosphate N-acetyltransferase